MSSGPSLPPHPPHPFPPPTTPPLLLALKYPQGVEGRDGGRERRGSKRDVYIRNDLLLGRKEWKGGREGRREGGTAGRRRRATRS